MGVEMNTEAKLNLIVFILAVVHWFVSLINCTKRWQMKEIMDISKVPNKVLTCLMDYKNWNKHTWCISLIVMTAIVIISGLNQWMKFEDDDEKKI